MGLSQSHKAIIAKAQSVGAGQQGISLNPNICTYLIAVIVSDLGLVEKFPDLGILPGPFFSSGSLADLTLAEGDFLQYFEQLLQYTQDADTYFHCLATLHKARLKYEKILQTQPVPTIDQVGPRGMLQFGSLSPKALAGLLLWRKWIYDIDNRAAQETGYVFEPIIAASIGGVPVSATKSPIRRQSDKTKGRQVDCIRPDGRAYEIKIRVTIAASGQGRWREELDFPTDCKASGYTPVLVVLDPTPNVKLQELKKSFLAVGGEVFIGEAAWEHLRSLAGATMSKFLEIYVHQPIQALLSEVPKKGEAMAEISFFMTEQKLEIKVGTETYSLNRTPLASEASEEDSLPEDVDEQTPGPS